MIPGALRILVRDEALWCLPQRALYWPRQQTLVVADLHFGKAETFRSAAIPLPPGTPEETLHRLDAALQVTQARRLLVLGDFWHARVGQQPEVMALLEAWRMRHGALAIDVVLGNHDRRVQAFPTDWKITVHDQDWSEGPFRWSHFAHEESAVFTWGGHEHPVIKLSGRGRQSLRLPCFWIRETAGILPAFGSFTGGHAITPGLADRVLAIAGSEVIDVSSCVG